MSKNSGISDNNTKEITAMKNACSSLNKELSETQVKLNSLNKTKISLDIDTSSAISDLKKVEKQLSETDDAADNLKKGLNKSFDSCVKDIENVTSEAKSAEEAIKSLNQTAAKSKDINISSVSSSSSSSSSSSGKLGSALSLLDSSGALDFLGDFAIQGVTAYSNSKYSEDTGTLVDSSLNGAKTGAGIGATIGSAIAPGVGTAVGAVLGTAVGGLVGYAKGKLEVFEKEDEAFKEYYSNLFETVEQEWKDSLTNGSSIAAERESAAYSGNADEPDNTYQGLVNQLDKAHDNLDADEGESYNATRNPELQYEIDAYTGEYSDELTAVRKNMGEYEAALENKKGRLKTDAELSIVSGEVQGDYIGTEQGEALQQLIDAYQQAQKDLEYAEKSGNEAGMLAAQASQYNAFEAADALAVTTYDVSDEAKTENARQSTLADSIKDISGLDDESWQAGYDLAQQFTEGLKSVNTDFSVTVTPVAYTGDGTIGGGTISFNVGATNSKSGTSATGTSGGTNFPPASNYFGTCSAFGLSYVPYNGYPATLHEGERVLTASENRNYGTGTASVVISGNSFVIREEADIDKVAKALITKINQACALSV